MIKEGKNRKQEAISLGFNLQWGHSLLLRMGVSAESLPLSQFKFSRSRTCGLFSHSHIELLSASISWNEREKKKGGGEEEKKKGRNRLTNSVRAPLLTNLLCPREPAGCAAMLPAALFRKVPFASPSVRLLTAFSQKWVSFCLPEIAEEQNKSRYNE